MTEVNVTMLHPPPHAGEGRKSKDATGALRAKRYRRKRSANSRP
jgi:hypothetical protein